MTNYEVNPRNGYNPVDRYNGDSLLESLIIPRLSRRDANTVAAWLNRAYEEGLRDAKAPKTELC